MEGLSQINPEGSRPEGFIWLKLDIRGFYLAYLIVESVSFVLLRDVYPINPKRTVEIINSRDVYRYIP